MNAMLADGVQGAPRTRRGRLGRRGARRSVLHAIRLIPAYLRLLAGLLGDRRVSALDKLLVAGAIAYVVMPIDLIPDFIPFLGQVDDVYFLMLALGRLLSRAGEDVLVDHWSGDPADLSVRGMERTLAAAALFLPPAIRRRLRRSVV